MRDRKLSRAYTPVMIYKRQRQPCPPAPFLISPCPVRYARVKREIIPFAFARLSLILFRSRIDSPIRTSGIVTPKTGPFAPHRLSWAREFASPESNIPGSRWLVDIYVVGLLVRDTEGFVNIFVVSYFWDKTQRDDGDYYPSVLCAQFSAGDFKNNVIRVFFAQCLHNYVSSKTT